MTYDYYRTADEALKKGMEAHLIDIIGIFSDNASDSDDVLRLRAIYDRILSDARLLKTATDIFTEAFFDDDSVKQLETSIAAEVITKVAGSLKEENKPSTYSIERDGKTITLTEKEVEAITRERDRERDIMKLNDLLDNIGTVIENESAGPDEDVGLYGEIMAKLKPESMKRGFLASLGGHLGPSLIEMTPDELFGQSDKIERLAFANLYRWVKGENR